MKQPDPGTLLVVGIEGTAVDDTTRRFFHEDRVGGVILFQRNAVDGGPPVRRAALRTLIGELNALAEQAGLPKPLIMVDHEGGRVHRFGDALTQFPPPGLLALLGESAVRDVAQHQARELRSLGFNTILGPVLDLCPAEGTASHIATRSYGPDPSRTAELGTLAIEAFTAEGLLCVPKHFPGYGAAPIDPHLDLPTRHDSLDAMREHDLVPFARAIARGAPAIMTAHIVATAVDPELPCTLAPAWLRLLRGELGFEGCVVSDDLCMGSVKDRYGPAELSERCVRAGLDLLLVCHPGADTLGSIRARLGDTAATDSLFATRLAEAHAHVEAARALASAKASESDSLFEAGQELLQRVSAPLD